MPQGTERTDPKLWERVKARVTRGEKGGGAGQWSARKAQLAVQDYKRAGGGYRGGKDARNRLAEWTREDWGTKSGRRSQDSGERYLPKKTRSRLSDDEYRRTSAKKRADTAHGKQFSRQPKDVAAKAARDRRAIAASAPRSAKTTAARGSAPSRADLLARAGKAGIPGRHRMRKDDLIRALRRA